MAGLSFAAFRVPSFALLFAGQFVAQTGLWFQTLSISFFVVQLTGSAGALAFVTVATFGPTLLLAPAAARAIDRWGGRSVISVSCAASALAALAIAVLLAAGSESLIALYLLIAAGGSAAVFTRIAAQALVYPVVGPELLQNGVTLSSLYASVARSVGPGLAGLALAGAGAVWCQVITALCFAAAAASVAGIRTPHTPAEAPGDPAAGERPPLSRRVIVILLVNVAVTFLALNLAVVVTSAVTIAFGGDADALGAAHALNAVGAIVGGVLVTRFPQVRATAVAPACLVLGITFGLTSAAPSLLLFLLVSPVLGIGFGVYQAVMTTALQTETPPRGLPRAISLLTMGTFGVMPFGAVAAGAVIDATSDQFVLQVSAIACVVAAGAAFMLIRRTAL
jgi:MFS family permease